MTVDDISRETGLPTDICHLILDELSREGEGLNLVIKKIGHNSGSYAISDEDFPVFLESGAAVAAFFAGVEPEAWIPMIVAGVVHLTYSFRKKHIPITAVQALIIKEIKDAGGLTVNALKAALSNYQDGMIDIPAEIQALMEMRKSDGTAAEIIQRDENGVIFVNGF